MNHPSFLVLRKRFGWSRGWALRPSTALCPSSSSGGPRRPWRRWWRRPEEMVVSHTVLLYMCIYIYVLMTCQGAYVTNCWLGWQAAWMMQFWGYTYVYIYIYVHRYIHRYIRYRKNRNIYTTIRNMNIMYIYMYMLYAWHYIAMQRHINRFWPVPAGWSRAADFQLRWWNGRSTQPCASIRLQSRFAVWKNSWKFRVSLPNEGVECWWP